MCKPKPGLRCGKHANQALKNTYKQYQKIDKEYQKNPTEALATARKILREKYHYSKDLYFASNNVFKTIDHNHTSYKKYDYLNKTLNNITETMEDNNSESKTQVGNRINYTNNKITKNPTSTTFIIHKNKNTITLWDEKNPEEFIFINNKDQKEPIVIPIKIFNLSNPNPDLRWAIWASLKTNKELK